MDRYTARMNANGSTQRERYVNRLRSDIEKKSLSNQVVEDKDAAWSVGRNYGSRPVTYTTKKGLEYIRKQLRKDGFLTEVA